MKLFIINGENNDQKKEIHIKEDLTVEDIKFKLIEIPHENRKFTTACYRFIHKNIILFEYVSIKYYKVCENDTLWFGDISNYLRKNDVIIYVFYVSTICDMNCLIVKKSDKISKIRSMIERIQGQIITIWNADGKKMKDDQIVTEIDKNENYKLIIRCDDTEGNKINYTFDQYCWRHDEGIVDMYLYVDKIRDDNKNESTRPILINGVNQIRQMVQFFLTYDDRLNKKLSDFPPSLLNSINLFCNYLSNHILYISFDYWIFVINQYNHEFFKIFNMIYEQYFQFAILAATWDFSNNRQRNNKTNKLVGEILIDSLNYILKYLSDSSNDWQYWLRFWMNSYLLKPFSDFRLNARIAKCKINKFTIKMRMNEKDRNNFISYKPKTILEAKKSLSAMHNIDMKSLYCIKPGGDHKLNDEDKFDDEFKIEMTLSMDNIEILRLLGQGAFGATYLCLDNISNKQFVLKKAIRSDGDLYRDISNYSKLASSLYIINYSGLFRDGENICIGMEYMSGGSLRSYLSERKYLSEQELVRISYEILTQINDSHKLGIIHRDIKSDNIVLDEHNHAKLIDFGISKDTTGLTSKDLSDKLQAYKPGTFYYMAPELVKEEPYSEKIDIWSFGMVMVEMVTGKIPFPALKPFQVILKLRNLTKYEFEPNFSISNELKHFINSSLITIPNERPSAEQLIMSELFIDYLKKV